MRKKTLDEFILELKRRYGDRIYEVIVFGSYARGDASDESDIDVLIIGDVKLDEVIDVSYPLLLKDGVYIADGDNKEVPRILKIREYLTYKEHPKRRCESIC